MLCVASKEAIGIRNLRVGQVNFEFTTNESVLLILFPAGVFETTLNFPQERE
jgi:hypothetical protein